MARSQLATPKLKRSRPRTATKLKLVTAEDSPLPLRCLFVQGTGHPDCEEFFESVEALEGVVQLLRCALERSGRGNERLGQVEKSWTYRRDEQQWQWKVRALVPHSITASSVELAKHLVGRSHATEPIALVPVYGYTVH